MFKKYKSWRLHKHINKFGSKNLGYFCYFNRDWFDKWQWLLLWFLNAPILKYWGRFILRIHRDCKFNEVIDQIFPNSYRIQVGKNTYRSDFRTHQKFSKRIYYAFRPLWWTMHAWDWVFADRYFPELSFNYATLTVYPDADPETSTVDGYVSRELVSEIWATIRNGAGNGTYDSVTAGYSYRLEATATTDLWKTIHRGIYLFDTSPIDNSAVISAATLSLFGQSKASGDWTTTETATAIVASNPASNTALVIADFIVLGITLFSDTIITYTNWNITDYNNFTLNAVGISNISLTSISKFGTRDNTYDLPNTDPTWYAFKYQYSAMWNADQIGTSQDPKLVVQYSLPVSVGKPKLGGDGYSTGKVKLGG